MRAILAIFLLIASPGLAAPETSLRPLARPFAPSTDELAADLKRVRPAARAVVAAPVLDAAPVPPATRPDVPVLSSASLATPALARLASFRPQARPGEYEEGDRADVQLAGLSVSLKPKERPKSLVQRAMAKKRERERGMICGDPDLQGEVVGMVPGRIKGCGIESAVKVRSVLGVTLSQQALIDCPTAKALKTWVTKGMKPAVGDFGGGVAQIRVAAHYACRTRNNQAGQRISEHGKGRAIDISGFTMRNGQTVTLLDGWNARATSGMLRKMHSRACGPFGTVLGPDSNKFHRDHFHFDTARYRSGSYCR